jgi:hypothetical protein
MYAYIKSIPFTFKELYAYLLKILHFKCLDGSRIPHVKAVNLNFHRKLLSSAKHDIQHRTTNIGESGRLSKG